MNCGELLEFEGGSELAGSKELAVKKESPSEGGDEENDGAGDHIIPRSVCPELDNSLFNLEFMPLTLNQKKAAKVTQRQVALAKEGHQKGLLSEDELRAVEARKQVISECD